MKRFALTLLVGLAAVVVFAQALPGQNDGRISRAGGGKPGGSSPQTQYNNGGKFGGVANVTSDGTHDIYQQETLPAAPGSGSMGFDMLDLPVPAPMRLDWFMQLPMPVGLYRTGGMSFISTSAQWYSCQNYPSQWNSTTFDVGIGCPPSVINPHGSAASGGGWATDFTHRFRRVGWSTIAGQTWVGIQRGSSLPDGEWVGNSAGIGGFVMHTRFWGNTHEIGDGTFVGVSSNSSGFVTGSRPAQQVNTAYVGCDATDTNLQVCSNDGTTTSCSDTNVNLPCRTNGTIFDVWLAMPPNAKLPDAGTGFVAYIERLDAAANITVTKTGNMPTNNVQLTPYVQFLSPDGGTLTEKIEVSDLETWSNL